MIVRRGLPAAVWAAAILWLATRPADELPAWDLRGLDKIIHFAVYAVLAWLVRRAGPAGGAGPAVAVAVAIAVAHGALVEWLQMRVPGRSAEGLDLLADATGAVVGAWAWARAGRDQSPQTRA